YKIGDMPPSGVGAPNGFCHRDIDLEDRYFTCKLPAQIVFLPSTSLLFYRLLYTFWISITPHRSNKNFALGRTRTGGPQCFSHLNYKGMCPRRGYVKGECMPPVFPGCQVGI